MAKKWITTRPQWISCGWQADQRTYKPWDIV